MMNENAIANLLLDADFVDEELKRSGHLHGEAFTEFRSVRHPPPEAPVAVRILFSPFHPPL